MRSEPYIPQKYREVEYKYLNKAPQKGLLDDVVYIAPYAISLLTYPALCIGVILFERYVFHKYFEVSNKTKSVIMSGITLFSALIINTAAFIFLLPLQLIPGLLSIANTIISVASTIMVVRSMRLVRDAANSEDNSLLLGLYIVMESGYNQLSEFLTNFNPMFGTFFKAIAGIEEKNFSLQTDSIENYIKAGKINSLSLALRGIKLDSEPDCFRIISSALNILKKEQDNFNGENANIERHIAYNTTLRTIKHMLGKDGTKESFAAVIKSIHIIISQNNDIGLLREVFKMVGEKLTAIQKDNNIIILSPQPDLEAAPPSLFTSYINIMHGGLITNHAIEDNGPPTIYHMIKPEIYRLLPDIIKQNLSVSSNNFNHSVLETVPILAIIIGMYCNAKDNNMQEDCTTYEEMISLFISKDNGLDTILSNPGLFQEMLKVTTITDKIAELIKNPKEAQSEGARLEREAERRLEEDDGDIAEVDSEESPVKRICDMFFLNDSSRFLTANYGDIYFKNLGNLLSVLVPEVTKVYKENEEIKKVMLGLLHMGVRIGSKELIDKATESITIEKNRNTDLNDNDSDSEIDSDTQDRILSRLTNESNLGQGFLSINPLERRCVISFGQKDDVEFLTKLLLSGMEDNSPSDSLEEQNLKNKNKYTGAYVLSRIINKNHLEGSDIDYDGDKIRNIIAVFLEAISAIKSQKSNPNCPNVDELEAETAALEAAAASIIKCEDFSAYFSEFQRFNKGKDSLSIFDLAAYHGQQQIISHSLYQHLTAGGEMGENKLKAILRKFGQDQQISILLSALHGALVNSNKPLEQSCTKLINAFIMSSSSINIGSNTDSIVNATDALWGEKLTKFNDSATGIQKLTGGNPLIRAFLNRDGNEGIQRLLIDTHDRSCKTIEKFMKSRQTTSPSAGLGKQTVVSGYNSNYDSKSGKSARFNPERIGLGKLSGGAKKMLDFLNKDVLYIDNTQAAIEGSSLVQFIIYWANKMLSWINSILQINSDVAANITSVDRSDEERATSLSGEPRSGDQLNTVIITDENEEVEEVEPIDGFSPRHRSESIRKTVEINLF